MVILWDMHVIYIYTVIGYIEPRQNFDNIPSFKRAILGASIFSGDLYPNGLLWVATTIATALRFTKAPEI